MAIREILRPDPNLHLAAKKLSILQSLYSKKGENQGVLFTAMATLQNLARLLVVFSLTLAYLLYVGKALGKLKGKSILQKSCQLLLLGNIAKNSRGPDWHCGLPRVPEQLPSPLCGAVQPTCQRLGRQLIYLPYVNFVGSYK